MSFTTCNFWRWAVKLRWNLQSTYTTVKPTLHWCLHCALQKKSDLPKHSRYVEFSCVEASCEEALSHSRTLHCSLCHSRSTQLEKAKVRMSASVHPRANPSKEIMCPKCCRISAISGESANKYKHAQVPFLFSIQSGSHCYHHIQYEESVCHLLVLFPIKQGEADDHTFTFTQSRALTQKHTFTRLVEKKKTYCRKINTKQNTFM